MGKRRPRGCRSIIVDNYSNVRMSAFQRGGMKKVGPSAPQPAPPPPYTEQPTTTHQQQPNMGYPDQGFAPGYAYPPPQQQGYPAYPQQGYPQQQGPYPGYPVQQQGFGYPGGGGNPEYQQQQQAPYGAFQQQPGMSLDFGDTNSSHICLLTNNFPPKNNTSAIGNCSESKLNMAF